MKKKILLIICSLFILLHVRANTVRATTSGDWSSTSTWQGGVIPGDFDTVIINPGVTVTYSATKLSTKTPYIKINGTLTFTAAFFLFNYPVNIDIENGGTLQDNTTKPFVLHYANDGTKGDTVNIFSGGQFLTQPSPGTKIKSYNGAVNGDSITLDTMIIANPDSVFKITVDVTGKMDTDRFQFTVTLPVSLYNFTGQYKNNAVLLNWNTASEQNNAYFELQRSLDGESFNAIATIKGTGTSNQPHSYEYTDWNIEKIGANQLFYRLKQVDVDGKATFYKIIRVAFEDAEPSLKLWPNPNSGQFILQLGQVYQQDVLVRIYDAQGRLVSENRTQQSQLNINLATKGKGIYFIQIHFPDGNKKVLSALVQ